jgi:hypothetical protein
MVYGGQQPDSFFSDLLITDRNFLKQPDGQFLLWIWHSHCLSVCHSVKFVLILTKHCVGRKELELQSPNKSWILIVR